MDTKDFTYGIPLKKERDLKKTMDYFKFIHSKHIPVRVTAADGQYFCMHVNSFDNRGNRIFLGTLPFYEKENRVIIPVHYIISAEQILAEDVDKGYKGQLTIKRIDLEDAGFTPSGRDFFQVIRYAYQKEKGIRVYLSDNLIIEGVSTGMDEQSVGIRLPEGNMIQVFYDWVDRIVPI